MTQPDRRHLRRARLALAVVAVAGLAAWWWFPGGRTFLQQSLTALASLDPQQVRGFIAAWGPQAALVSFALMILQAIVAPLPAFLITLANAALFGAFWGGALSWFSAMVGAGLCFCIARALGREVVEKLPAARCCAASTAISLALARRRSWSAACCRLCRLTRSAMPPD